LRRKRETQHSKREDIMSIRRIALGAILSIAVAVFASAPVRAEPVLVKLALQKPGDWTDASSIGVVAYHRFDNSVLAELERTKLEELDRLGLEYRIVDEEPWSQDYFLVSPVLPLLKVNLQLYGKVILEGPEWQLIKTSREKAFELKAAGYNIAPVSRSPIPLRHKPPVRAAKRALEYSADIDSLVNLVSADSLYAWDLRLQNFKTRYSYSDSIHRARQWIFDKFLDIGIDSVWFHHYFWDSDQYNVVATVVGTAMPDRVIVVGGHYDSVVYGSGTDPFLWAPGADDDASGTAATLEMARIIAENPLPVTVIFTAFAQEEQFLIGSDYFAGYLYNLDTDLELMVNCDMIGHSVDSDQDVDIRAFAASMPFAEIMSEMADAYTYIRPYWGGNWVSDEFPFQDRGYYAVGVIEGDFHTAGWHTNYDVVDSLDFDYMREVVKMCLATVLLVGKSPSPVESLEAVDAGDGNRVYLSWAANAAAENVSHYNLYFGTSSGSYDSLRQVDAPCDTLADLTENTTYFVAVTAVNGESFESPTAGEVSATPREVPLPPSGLMAYPFETYKIKLDWSPNQEADLDYYNIYRSEESGSGYQLLAGAHTDTTFVDSSVQGDVEYYYYTLTAVDTSGNESAMSEEAQGAAVTLDQGILVLDETYDDVAYNMVNSDSINAFYQRALDNYTHAYADHSCPNCFPGNQINLKELGRYEAVIVHSEDHRGNRSLGARDDSTYSVLKSYVTYGGKVIIEGRRNLSEGDDGDWALRDFLPGDVPFDYLQVQSAYNPPWSPTDYRTEVDSSWRASCREWDTSTA
jgi:fibronectin type 3 domain-containing protein